MKLYECLGTISSRPSGSLGCNYCQQRKLCCEMKDFISKESGRELYRLKYIKPLEEFETVNMAYMALYVYNHKE